MKKQIIKSFALFSLLLVAGFAQAVSAQTPASVVVDVPFDFVAGGERLPAGVYQVSRLSANSEKALVIRSLDGRRQAALITHAAAGGDKKAPAQLTFRQYGDIYFLAEVRSGVAGGARGVATTRAEKDLRRELRPRASADSGEECETVVVSGSVR